MITWTSYVGGGRVFPPGSLVMVAPMVSARPRAFSSLQGTGVPNVGPERGFAAIRTAVFTAVPTPLYVDLVSGVPTWSPPV